MGARETFSRHWFIYTMCAVIVLAFIAPGVGSKGGLIYPEITVKCGAVSIIFFLSGLSLQASDVHAAMSQTWLHVFVQGTTFLIYPLLMKMVCLVLHGLGNINKSLLEGLQVVSCMPPPVSSAVILTRTCRGNVAAAIFNSVVGSFLGLFLTPLSLRLWLGVSASIPIIDTILYLMLTVLMPLCAGHLYQRRGIHPVIMSRGSSLGTLGQWMLLLIIYSTFCDMFRSSRLEELLPRMASTVLIVVCMQCALLYGTWWVSHRWLVGWFSRGDTLAIMFCSTHKSLTLGLPILRILVSEVTALGELALPLLVYHPLQMVLGGTLTPYLIAWARHAPERVFASEV
nr:sodium/bile acid cotransporter 7-like isoform X1 [Procambarus clarkii]